MIVEEIDADQKESCCNPNCNNNLYGYDGIIPYDKGVNLVVYETHVPTYLYYCNDCALKFAEDITSFIKFKAFK